MKWTVSSSLPFSAALILVFPHLRALPFAKSRDANWPANSQKPRGLLLAIAVHYANYTFVQNVEEKMQKFENIHTAVLGMKKKNKRSQLVYIVYIFNF